MSYIVNTCVAPFCHSQNHSGGVPVTPGGMPTGGALESSHVQVKPLVSRKALTARHRCVRGLNHHHLSASPSPSLQQFTFRCADRGISSLTRHRGSRQKLRLEVLHGNRCVALNDPPSPHPRIVLSLAGRLLVESSCLPAGISVALGLRVPALAVAPRHFALSFGQLCSAALPVAGVLQVETRIGCGGHGADTPVDTDTATGIRQRGCFAAHNKRGIPMPQRVPVDVDRSRLAGQIARPHHRHGHTLGEYQTVVANRETVAGVFQRRQRCLTRLKGRPAAAFHGERMAQRRAIGAQHLLLGHLGPLPQPRAALAGSGKHPRQLAKRRPDTRFLLVDSFIPQKPAPVPFGFQSRHSSGSRPQTVGVPHRLNRLDNHTDHSISQHRHSSRPYLPTAKAGGLSGGIR